MQFPIVVGLRRSRIVDGILLVSTVIGLLALAFTNWSLVTSCLLAVATTIVAFFAARAMSPQFRTLRIDENGHISCLPFGASEFAPVRLLPGATAHPWLTVMRLAQVGGTWLMVVAPDSVAPEEFRRLRVWLRWHGPVSDGSDDF